MKRIVILASGSGSLAHAIMTATKDYLVVALVSDRPKAKALEIAKEFGIATQVVPMLDDRKLWDQEILEVVKSYQPDLVVSAGFMRILPAEFVQTFKVINSHPALLPLFPGAHAVRDALAAGATTTGTTIHWVDEGVDTGSIIAQASVEIIPTDTEETLHERIKIIERGLIVATIPEVLAQLK